MQLILATRNRHKLAEVGSILGGSTRLTGLAELPGVPDVVEDAPTFAGNAAKKAVALAAWLAAQPAFAGNRSDEACLVLADDSGLEVDALGGAPGVHSARFAALDSGAAGNSTDAASNAKLLRRLADVPVGAPGSEPEFFDGVCEGHVLFAPRGANGFGYDPLFVPDGFELTFAELGEEVKNRHSHRARALAGLKAWLERGRGTIRVG